MISSVGISEVLYHSYKKQVNNNKEDINGTYARNVEYQPYSSKLLKNYFIPFTGKQPKEQRYDNEALELIEKVNRISKGFQSPEINYYHMMYSLVEDAIDYINKLNSGDLYISDIPDDPAVRYITEIFDVSLLENTKLRQKTLEYFKNLLVQLEQLIRENNNKTAKANESNASLPKQIVNDIISYKDYKDGIELNPNSIISYGDICDAMIGTTTKPYQLIMKDFAYDLNNLYMVADKDASRLSFNSYAEKARDVMMNLAHNTNVFLTYDDTKVVPSYIIPSIQKAFESGKYKFNHLNTELIEYNEKVNTTQIINSVNKFEKDKKKDYILVINQKALYHNSEDPEELGVYKKDGYIKILKNTPKNVHIILYDTNDNYLSEQGGSKKPYNDFAEITIPVLNTDDVLNAIVADKVHFAPKFTKHAIEKVVTLSTQTEGILPNKTIDLIRNIYKYYQEKDTITPDDIDKYIEDRKMFFGNNSEDSLEMMTDTGKRLKDIVGKYNTKQEAKNIVNQIKSGKLGTKGYIIYSEDGSVGSGRRHTAEAIAGEAQIPFFALNAAYFGAEDVSIFDGSSLSPEASIKKVFSLVKTQAESNPNKSAELFIENFEYFSIGGGPGLEYHQKAMAQLIREMNMAEKRGYNIVVIGSVNDPEMMGEAIAKSFKFNDTIEVSSPAYSEEARLEILELAFENIKISGKKEERKELLSSMAKTLYGFSFIGIKNFAQKADYVAKERGHKRVAKEDMVEAYLRLTTGRPNLSKINSHEKEIVAKHECGHAITLQVMYDLMNKTGRPWLIPNTVNFITLDPRGMYGGAMYSKAGNNKEYSFEKMFSDIVSDYGGYSAEKRFYEMDGSWGISSDLRLATRSAQLMTKVMGQGPNTGKISIDSASIFNLSDSLNMTSKMKEKIDKDIEIITRNALTVSDMIVDNYSDFIDEFADKYASKVGTGECLVDGDTFRKELKEWTEKQTPQKRAELERLETSILEAIAATKRGDVYNTSQDIVYSFNTTLSLNY